MVALMNMRVFLLGALMATVLTSTVVRAELVVEVTQGSSEPTPIAVVPFQWNGAGALPEDVAQIVEQDLSRSGLFTTLSRDLMLSLPSDRSKIFFRDWRMTQSDFLVVGRIEPMSATRVSIQYELYDVLKEENIMIQPLESEISQLRDASHFIADQIYQALTGNRGAFSTRIVYVTAQQVATEAARYRLEMADWDGNRPRVILESREPIMSPSWSADGKKIAYVSFETGRPAIYVQYLATGKRERIQSFSGLNGAPAWSPDGQQLALVLSKDGNPEIYVLDVSTGELQRVTNHYGIDTEPSWSPDGQSLVFTSDRGGSPQIYRLFLSTRQLERVTYEGNYNARASITPDGRFLAMVHRSGGSGNRFSVAVLDLKTDRLDILTETGLEESPTIAPNASVVLYATQEGTQGVLSAVSLDGQVRFRMPNTRGDVRAPAWSPYLY